ncbi:MAG: tol-pal system-associated acyl-CoA thioesterase [Alphaproteobacteria bacterium]|nr:tol-pal system-associated acyl-CoA thioesterase [Alphaproteobacteria bacterium]
MAPPISHPSHSSTKTHHISFRVYYEDTDAGGIVYHANYLRFAERARTEFLRSTGYDHQRVKNEHNILLVVRHAEIDYRAPARLDDLLEVRTRAVHCGNTSLQLEQCVYCGDRLITDMKVTVVAVTPEGKAVRIPAALREVFKICPDF